MALPREGLLCFLEISWQSCLPTHLRILRCKRRAISGDATTKMFETLAAHMTAQVFKAILTDK